MSRYDYIDGNTVRRTEVQPQRRTNLPDQRTVEEQQRRKHRRNAARRNRERALYMSSGYVAFLTLCVLLVAGSAVTLIGLQSQITQRRKNIAAMESQLADLKADNDARYKEIVTSVDYDHIREVAMNELGMHYATEDQLIYFTVENENFMDQYADISQ